MLAMPFSSGQVHPKCAHVSSLPWSLSLTADRAVPYNRAPTGAIAKW